MSLLANSSWFDFAVGGVGSFPVYSFEGKESVSEPFEFAIEFVSLSASEDITVMLGLDAHLSILERSGITRHVHGVIRQIEQLHTANRFTHYKCLLVPRFWFLGLNQEQRVFQNKNIIDIIENILKQQGFDYSLWEFKCADKYPVREYCVQYAESDLHFISRLCEEEGIYYYFEHSENKHKLIFSDREGGPSVSGKNGLRYFQGSGSIAESAVISRLSYQMSLALRKSAALQLIISTFPRAIPLWRKKAPSLFRSAWERRRLAFPLSGRKLMRPAPRSWD
ncbi:MAG: type VI secretion system tip protein VgrG [Desulfarculales bacterium]|jgi:type VI secretion system secreted protein VgrG|nr:type VI secretion system tip protein VgrG [Desulfarculales bacterium]